jgi:hypothetical protein
VVIVSLEPRMDIIVVDTEMEVVRFKAYKASAIQAM